MVKSLEDIVFGLLVADILKVCIIVCDVRLSSRGSVENKALGGSICEVTTVRKYNHKQSEIEDLYI
jgi:hypothetical protein